jgi:hypothetical protein
VLLLLTKIRFSLNVPTRLVEDAIKLGDKINYWLGIHVWGDESTKRSSTVVKILSAQEIYEPHLCLDNGDTVQFGDIIQKVEEPITDGSCWRASSGYVCIPSQDKKGYCKSISRDSDRFKSLVSTVCKVAAAETGFLLGGKENTDSTGSVCVLTESSVRVGRFQY